MKRIMTLLVFFALTIGASAQSDLWNAGVVHTIAPATAGPSTDSVHDMGYVDMILSPRGDAGGLQYADSMQVYVEAGDSLRISLFIVENLGSSIGTETIADSVAVIPSNSAPVAGIWTEVVAKGTILFPWHNIVGAIKSNASAASLRVYIKVFKVGSEVASSNKKFRVVAKRFY